MQFPSTYFEDEVRDGFYVSSMMKHAWAAQLEILKDIDKVCRKYGITYFADCGTLLGTVRHKGFIPWDDDLDISMKREDYYRFLAVAEDAMPEGYSVISFHKDKEWQQLFIRVVNSRKIRFDKPFLDKFHDFPFACGVDIFPIDFLPPDKREEELLHSLLEIVVNSALEIADREKVSEEMAEQRICQIEQLCQMKIDRTVSLKTGLYLLSEKLCSLYSEQEAQEVTLTPVWMENTSYRTKKEYYQETVMLPFENMAVPVPAAYDAILKYRYGDYMRLVRNWTGHDFLGMYKEQENVLSERYGISFTKYVFSKEDLECNMRQQCVKRQGRKEVVFLPFKASEWDSMESVWRAAEEDPDCDVYVIPIPYYDKDLYGNFRSMHYDGDKYPDYVPITKYNEFDFAVHHPDVIFIHNPYDEYNYATSVEPFFYSRNLRQYTDQLVYIPYFVLDEIDPQDEPAIAMMDYFVTVPGVVFADKVIVQSENMKQLYIDKLVKFAGEETRNVWENKILGLGSPKRDKRAASDKENLKIPEGWLKVLKKPDGTWKKVVLYYICVASFMDHREQALKKMQSVLEIFKDNCEEVAVLWREDSLIQSTLSYTSPQLLEGYWKIAEQYKTEGWGIYDNAVDFEWAVKLCDAYYGDAGRAAQLCRGERKPVMLANYEC